MPDSSLRARGLDPAAHALTLFRVLPNGEGRAYTATTFPKDPWEGCEHTIRTARFLGYIADEGERYILGDGYGVLDVLDENGDIVQDFMVKTADGFQWLKRRLDLRVEADDE